MRSGTEERRTARRTLPYGGPCWGSRRPSSKTSRSTNAHSCWWLMFVPGNGRGAGVAGADGDHRPMTAARGRRRGRALDLGTIQTVLEAEAPRVRCRVQGPTVAAVPWARHPAGHTYAFDEQAGWLATQCSKTAITQLMRTAWRTVGAIITRNEKGAPEASAFGWARRCRIPTLVDLQRRISSNTRPRSSPRSSTELPHIAWRHRCEERGDFWSLTSQKPRQGTACAVQGGAWIAQTWSRTALWRATTRGEGRVQAAGIYGPS